MESIEAALTYARNKREEHLADYKALLTIPSISTLPEHREDVLRTAQWLADHLKRFGMQQVKCIPTAGHPIVYGEWLKAPGKPVVLVYGHYDVQPVDPIEEWESEPFSAEVRGNYIYARGASDMKGQLLAQLKAMESLSTHGDFPVNVKYLLEGEEEIGSPHLSGFIETHKELLACDIVLNCDAGIHAPDGPSIVYALRGLAYFEVEVQGPAKDLHSGMFGGSIRNPIHVLCEVIAGMHDAEGRVTLPGFYNAVRPLDEEERRELARFPYSNQEWFNLTGASGLYGESGYSTLERVGARPTLEINGIWGGFTGTGAKTVLPARASAKLSMRLVADQKPESIRGMLQRYLEEHMPAGVQWSLQEHSHGPGAIMNRNSPYMKTALAALKATFGVDPIFRREGGSVPVVGIMQELLGVDSIMLGFALPDDGIHGPNERQYLPNFFKGIETYIRFMAGLASMQQ
ncbi:MAG TPA: dipeptidase [Candidatus Hydrogenedentes bacterium]|nr:dipeptidase [Candidatus Hydrogenedentota bacterium]